ncbi:MAG: metal ABC transporter solute-binding protein, Zn/Mn family [Rhizobiaceae bacterium]
MLKSFMLSTAILIAGSGMAQAEALKVVSSFSILGDIAKNIGGDKVEIVTLVGPDSDAHVYEPKPADVASVASAKVVLINGLGFEGFIDRLVKTSATTATVVEVSKGVEVIEAGQGHHDEGHGDAKTEAGHGDHAHGEEKKEAGHDDHAHAEESKAAEAGHSHAEEKKEAAHDHGETDPHAFQSVPNVRAYVKNIAEAFCANDSANCTTYQANASAYDAKLAALDKEIRDAVATIPEAKRTVITGHDAFGYFAHEYGLKFIAPEGVSTDAEASAADVAKLVDQIREDKASALFVENISNPRLVEQIGAETGIKVGGTLYSDALSAEGGPASTFIDMMRHNVTTIKSAIVGS